LIGGFACLGCGALGFALGERRVLMTTEPVAFVAPPKAPIPIIATPCIAPEDAGPPALPTKVALVEPRLGEVPEPPRPRAPDERNRREEERPAEPKRTDEALAETLRAQGEAQAKQMAEMAAQLQELKSQLASAQQNQQGHDDDAEQQAAQHREALGALQKAQASLALGSTDIDGELAQAESVLSGPASAAIAKARQSLDNDDLFAARQYLQQAIVTDSSAAGSGAMIPAASESGHGHYGKQ
jgi:hypothetical protein